MNTNKHILGIERLKETDKWGTQLAKEVMWDVIEKLYNKVHPPTYRLVRNPMKMYFNNFVETRE